MEPNEEEKEKQAISDFKNGVLDYYKILGVSKTDDIDTIKSKGKNRLMKFHPDKVKKMTNDPEEIEKYNRQYDIIYRAYKVLRDPIKRKEYDLKKKAIDEQNFEKQKVSFKEFQELQEKNINPETKSMAKLEFQRAMNEMNEKRGFDPDADIAISKTDAMNRLSELMLQREQQDIECIPKKIFKGDQPTGEEFHKAFNKKWNQKVKKKEKQNNDHSIITLDGISAANDGGLFTEQYTSIDFNDDLIANGVGTTLYDNVNVNELNIDDDVSSNGEDYPEENFDDKPITDIEAKMREYEQQRNSDMNIKMDEMKSVIENPFNISSQFKNVIGEDISSKTPDKTKNKVDKKTLEAYKELLYDKKS
jgi:curved DNA-binding protein CbpA